VQLWPGPHAWPQAPQLFGSVLLCEHVHAPALQVWLAGHTVPHAPQLFGSVWRFEHALEQFVRPLAHDPVQTPAEHT